jgi:hypothetical protein
VQALKSHRLPLSAQAKTCRVGIKHRGSPRLPPLEAAVLVPLSQLVQETWNYAESKRLWRNLGDLRQVAVTLVYLAIANLLMDLLEERIQLAKEAFENFKRLEDTEQQA